VKVDLAVQTLSSSVANALEFLKDDLKLPEFKGCDTKIQFIRKLIVCLIFSIPEIHMAKALSLL